MKIRQGKGGEIKSSECPNSHGFSMVQVHSSAKISKTKCSLFFFSIGAERN